MAKFLDQSGVQHLWDKIGKKFVAQVEGKGLSANDFTNAYKGQLDNLTDTIASAIAGVTQISFNTTYSTLEELLAANNGVGEVGVIYLVKNKGSDNNVYDEYIYVNKKYELLGTTEVDLSAYLKIEEVSRASVYYAESAGHADGATEATTAETALNAENADYAAQAGKADKVFYKDIFKEHDDTLDLDVYGDYIELGAAKADAKGVTGNDGLMTKTQAAKLDGIAEGATADEALTDDEIDSAIAAAEKPTTTE